MANERLLRSLRRVSCPKAMPRHRFEYGLEVFGLNTGVALEEGPGPGGRYQVDGAAR